MNTRMNTRRYVLDDDGQPRQMDDLFAWATWFEKANEKRIVARDTVNDGVDVSTVFLGLDHSFRDGPPILWETMIFGGPHDGYQDRYSSWEAAIAGHAAALQLASGSGPHG